MTILELLTGLEPFSEVTWSLAVVKLILNEKAPRRPQGKEHVENGLDDDMWDLIKSCWQKDPAARPTIYAIKTQLAALSSKKSTREFLSPFPLNLPLF
jgi:serine/threonine protein kinase